MSTATPVKPAETKSVWPDPAAPSKGLLPRSLVAQREVRKFTFRTGVIGAVIVGLAALGWGALAASAVSAAADKANQELQNGTLQKSISELRVIDLAVKGFDAQRQNVAVALQNDVTYSTVISDLRAAAPKGVALDDIKTSFGTPCPGPDPFNAKPAIGCLTIDGAAPTVDDVSAYVKNLLDLSADPAKPAWLVDPYATTATAGTDNTGATGVGAGSVVRFTLTVNFSPAALSLKYAKFLPGTGITSTTTTPATPKAGG